MNICSNCIHKEICEWCTSDETFKKCCDYLPVRPKGTWIYKQVYDYEYWECSNCGEPWTTIEGTPKDNNMKFCPNCGADMRGSEE